MFDKWPRTRIENSPKTLDFMLDRRLKNSYGRYKDSKLNTLRAEFFEKKPMFVRQIVSDIRFWNPSVHHIRDKILFASADDVNIETKKGKISGAKVILQLNSSKTPYKTEMTMTTNRNGAFCA